MTAIRLSPSGPVITNPSGAPLDLGTGARLRLAEGTTTVGGTVNAITTSDAPIGSDMTVPGTALVVTLVNCDPAKNYRARVRCDVFNTVTTANLDVELKLQGSVDGGATWAELNNNNHGVSPAVPGAAAPDGNHATSGGFRTLELERPLTPGTGFGLTTAGQNLKVRAAIKGSALGGFIDSRNQTPGNFGTVIVQLEELF